MEWTQEARDALEMVPPFVRSGVTQSVQRFARERGFEIVTGDVLAMARDELMPGFMKGEAPAQPDADPIAKFYAKITDDPVAEAFTDNANPHAGAGGESSAGDAALAVWNESAAAADRSQRRAVYIHTPFCSSRCSFCPFYVNKSDETALADYADFVLRELDMTSRLEVATAHPIHSVYFGGGTPTDLSAHSLERILRSLRCKYPLANDCEITVEGRISGFDDDKIAACIDGGVNRFSIGVQSFDTKVRRGVGRKSERSEALRFLEKLCALDNAAVVIDLIYGLPGQNMELWLDDLQTLIGQTCVHGVDLYRLKMTPGSKLTQQRDSGFAPPDIRDMARMFEAGAEAMDAHSFVRLSNCHWARGTRERSRYNTDTAFGCTCLPIGCASGGKIANKRFFQHANLGDYRANIERYVKPIANAVSLPERSDVCDYISGCASLGFIDMERVEKFLPDGEEIAGMRRLLAQWEEAGLVAARGSGHARLTVAGQFWHVRLAQAMIDCIRPALSISS